MVSQAPLDNEVEVFSAPGENRECVEIARRVVALARNGIPLDRIAVLPRSEEYRSHLQEAFARADVPAHFARGAIRPDPAGRAFYSYGKVFVGPIEAARGLSFEAVLVPGLAEKMFPRKIVEEPILLDAMREQIGGGLATNESRLEGERLALCLAAGAAERRICLSYPRLDLDQARPRVPSFYALEAVRAAEGRLPDFAELARRAETATTARLGWPAPPDPAEAIDDAEHDLAILAQM